MMISVFTAHWRGTNPYVAECYASLCAQTYTDWEWIVLLNNGGELPAEIRADTRVWPVRFTGEGDNIGALKHAACDAAQGDVYVELDADDILTPDALGEIAAAFEDPEVAFAYSNSAQFTHETWAPHSYSDYWGWQSRPFSYEGHELIEMRAFPATPHSMRAIYWTPNHVRAWRATDYEQIGGHNVELAVIDDYDLLCRTYLHGKEMRHIDKCLYLYREHGEQTTKAKNPAIQATNWQLYARYIIPMVQEWARRQALPMLDLGAAHGKPEGYVGLDRHDADVICDLEQGIPYPDSSVGVIRANDVLEHMHDSVQIMNEIWRVLVPGGWLLTSVPSTDGRGAFQDPTHVSFWNQNSFWYYTDPRFAQYVPGIAARFQNSRVITWFPSDWHKEHDISYVDAQLIAVKDGYMLPGECPDENKWRNS